MNDLPKAVREPCPKWDLNPQSIDRQSNALPIAPPRHLLQ